MRYRPYHRYSPSGIEWLGDIPSHWTLPPLGARYSIELGKMLSETRITGRHLIPYLRNIDVQWDRIDVDDLPAMDVLPGEEARYTVLPGDLLVCEGGEVGRAAIVPAGAGRIAFQKALHRLRPRSNHELPRYLYYTLVSAASRGVLIAGGNPNTIPHLTGVQLRRYRFPCPPAAEQQVIADFLDAQTATIDALVAKKRGLVERLKEKRSALISRTVTRGLPPDAARAAAFTPKPKLKRSGIDWIGDVPERWSVAPLKSLVRVGNGSTPSRENPEYWSDGVFSWLNSSVVNRERVLEASELVTETALRECHLPRIIPPAVLVGITGEGRTRGMATTLLIEATINQHMAFLQPRGSRMDVWYLRRVLDHAYPYLRSESDGGGSTKGAITCDQLANLRVPVPPTHEQRAIAEYLDRETAKIDRLISKIEAAIDRLQEYRAALITAAVTGRIDVRAAVAREAAA